MNDICWGSVLFDDEVRDWISRLSEGDYGRVEFILGSEAMRVTYWIAPGRRIVMLTVFKKTRRREASQVMRARRAQWVCQEYHAHEMDEGK